VSSSRGESKKPPRTPARSPEARPVQKAGTRAVRNPLSARLTIKPGTQLRPRLQLVPSSKPRPGGLRRLSDVPLDEDEVLIDAFEATFERISVQITAVLERTCVYVDNDGNRRLANKKDVWVEADKLPIRRRGIG